ncbi:copper resistance CopC family protein [Arthrobacter sp. A5]|uniref:copper resistance CopC family protein n=1 Tax=Arthrobacter sp. A5 TaxID=576926 RepID=UPI003DA91C7F
MTRVTQRSIIGPDTCKTSQRRAGSERSHRRGRSRRGLVTAVLATVVLLLGLFGSASAASAHDAVESTSPGDGSTVATVPARITITLDNTPGALGSAIEVKDAAGNDWAEGPVDVLDGKVTQQLKPGAPAGKFTVLWRIVSSDGHAIEGTSSFTATAAEGNSAAAAAGTQVPITPVTDSAAPAAAPAAPSADGIPWAVIGMIVVLVGLVAGLAITAKRRLDKED